MSGGSYHPQYVSRDPSRVVRSGGPSDYAVKAVTPRA
jgi:hypothetical protein